MRSAGAQSFAMETLAEQRFSCVSPDGDRFELLARFGVPRVEAHDGPGGQHAVMLVSFEPLVPERRCFGHNQFQALCLGLDFLRTALKAFAARGGRIYWEDTDSPVDLASPWFGPYPDF